MVFDADASNIKNPLLHLCRSGLFRKYFQRQISVGRNDDRYGWERLHVRHPDDHLTAVPNGGVRLRRRHHAPRQEREDAGWKGVPLRNGKDDRSQQG